MAPRGISPLGHLAGTASMGTACRADNVATSADKSGDVAAAAGVGRLVSAATLNLAAGVDATHWVRCVVGPHKTAAHE